MRLPYPLKELQREPRKASTDCERYTDCDGEPNRDSSAEHVSKVAHACSFALSVRCHNFR